MSLAWTIFAWWREPGRACKAEGKLTTLKEQNVQVVEELAEATMAIGVMAAEMRTGVRRDDDTQMPGAAVPWPACRILSGSGVSIYVVERTTTMYLTQTSEPKPAVELSEIGSWVSLELLDGGRRRPVRGGKGNKEQD